MRQREVDFYFYFWYFWFSTAGSSPARWRLPTASACCKASFSGPSRAFSASRAFSSTLPDWAKRCCASLYWRAAVLLPSPSFGELPVGFCLSAIRTLLVFVRRLASEIFLHSV